MNRPTLPPQEIDARRKRARRLALWIGVAAALVYVGFIALVGLSK
ncbi:hypothetical protein [Agrilutibacter solisilvae]|nr:hypothetical protein [Lysobacter solisilvae]